MLKYLFPSLLLGASALSAQVIYSENFESYAPGATAVTGWTKVGGFGAAIVDASSPGSSASQVGYFDTNGAGFPTTTTYVVDTSVAYVAGTSYTLNFNLYKTGTGINDPYQGDVTYALYAFSGSPAISVDPTTAGNNTASLAAGTLLATGTAGGSTDGLISLSSIATQSGSGNVWIYFYAGVPTNTANYAQVEFDNISVSATAPIPEPASFAALAGVGLLAFAAGRRRRA
jgi:hypothetical protein